MTEKKTLLTQLETSNQFSDFDHKMMSLAISLAEQGQYSTTPNPNVGCVLVDKNQNIVGQGFHKRAGEGHAEINALAQAGELSMGASVYVSLEPCAHTGRTGPCALALIKAGVKNVIVACTDPNPKVAGKGIALLEQAGIKVRLGLLQAEAQTLNRYFFHRMSHRKPFVTVKLAASLDGKTALQNGESKWITSSQSRADVQIERAKACAILTGADTVIADNPQLNVRVNELPETVAEQFSWRQGQPLRVVVDSKNRLKNSFQMLNDNQATLVYNNHLNVNIQHSAVKQVQLTQQTNSNTSIAQVKQIDLSNMLDDLAKKEIKHLWVEAGASLTGALFDANLVDRLVLYQAPKLLGSAGRGLSNYTSPQLLKNAMSGKISSVQIIGPDVKLIIDFQSRESN